MKWFFRILWLVMFGILLFVVWQAFKYLRDKFASDLGKETTENLRTYSVKDWLMSLLSFDNGSSVGNWLFGKDNESGIFGRIFDWIGNRKANKTVGGGSSSSLSNVTYWI